MKVRPLPTSLLLLGLCLSGTASQSSPPPPKASTARQAPAPRTGSLATAAAGRNAFQQASLDPAAEQRIAALLARMTLEEKIGQMTLFTGDYDVTGPTVRPEYLQDLRKGHVGAVFNAMTPELLHRLQKIAVQETRLGIPLLFGYDVIHGHHTTFPIPLAEACSWDLDLMERTAHVSAAEAAADGLHWTFAPMVDIARDPRWGRIAEGAGEDPWLGSAIARARVRGFQGKDLRAPDSMLACVKHYAAYGAAQAGRDYHTVDLSRRTLFETYLPPYQAAIEEGAATVMSSFNEVDGVPATANSFLLDDVLRKAWGFKGFVVTDYTAINEMIPHGSAVDLADAAAQAARAGVDMDMQGAAYLTHLAAEVRAGRVQVATIDEAVRRILRVKMAKGLFDDPYRCFDPARRAATLRRPEHLALAREAARASIVLLKNAQAALPLRRGGLKVALIGPLANDRRNMTGTWAGQAQADRCVSVADALEARGKEVEVRYAKGCDILGSDTSGFDAAVQAARTSDVVVAVLGESTDLSGEACSRANLDLPGVQRELLKAVKATGKPVVLVLMNGRPLTLTWEEQHVDAILEAWHLGSEAGSAVCDVLFGDANPAGRLVTTFPRSVGQIPLYYSQKNTGRPYDPKNHFTSHYLDERNDPLFPFGFGLSYTTFRYAPLSLSSTTCRPDGHVDVQVQVTNTGERDGDEVAQLYIHQQSASVTRPIRELKGFQKVHLRKGETRTLTFRLGPAELSFLRRDMSRGTEPGLIDVWVGPDAASGSKATFRMTGRS